MPLTRISLNLSRHSSLTFIAPSRSSGLHPVSSKSCCMYVQYSNPNPYPFANQLECIDFLTPPTPLIIPHRLPAFLEYLMPLKN